MLYVVFKYTDTTILVSQEIVMMEPRCQEKNGYKGEGDDDVSMCKGESFVIFLFIRFLNKKKKLNKKYKNNFIY